LTAEPRITAQIRSPSRRASDSRLSTTNPQPSPRANPLASASNVLHRPSGDSAWVRVVLSIVWGDSTRLTPPASARSLSPGRGLRPARWTATSDDEHAVSTVRLGPDNPQVYDSRPAAMLSMFPVTP